MLSPPRGQSTCSFGRRRANVMRPLELYASHRPRVARARAARTPSIYGSSPRCARAARRARFRAACRFGGGRPAPPYGWDTRAARATHHAPRARTARTTLIAAHCTAHRAAPRTTRQAAPRCATHHPCALAIVGPGPPGAAAHKRTPGAHPFSRAVFVGARACRPFCTAHRAAPRATRHAAPRCATLRHARCRCHNPRWRLSERPGQAPRVSLGIR